MHRGSEQFSTVGLIGRSDDAIKKERTVIICTCIEFTDGNIALRVTAESEHTVPVSEDKRLG